MGGGVQVGTNGAGYNAGVSGGIPQANGGVNGGQSVEFGKPGGGRALRGAADKVRGDDDGISSTNSSSSSSSSTENSIAQ